MHGFLLQPWVTIQGTSTTTQLAQTETEYLDLAAFEDFTAWVEIKSLTAGGATSPSLFLESAPFKEDALFSPSGGTHVSVPLAVGLATARNILNASVPTQIPLARFLRWRLSMTGASALWSVTFQVHVAAHSLCTPPMPANA